jgi:hypothetical protein
MAAAQARHGGNSQAMERRNDLRSSIGLLLPWLQEPIEGVFDLTSTESVHKGMSGGVLFLGKQFVGILGTHAHSLGSGVLLNRVGQPLDIALNQQLEQRSQGISAAPIQRMRAAATKPSEQQLRGIETIVCEGQLPSPAKR